jgi:serine/threonine-protein kinase RsbW
VKPRQTAFRLTLSSTTRAITRVEPYIEKIRRALKLDEIQVNKLMVSVTEAVNNAILHGNKEHPDKKVTLVTEVLPGWLLVIISDQGHGFDPAKVSNPLQDENLLRESGRGIFLMRTLMDKVEIDRTKEGTHVRLWLDLNKQM